MADDAVDIGDETGESWNIVPSMDDQSMTMNALATSLAQNNLSQPPALPDGGAVSPGQKILSNLFANSGSGGQVAATNNSIVTRAIANQGQLLPIPGKSASSSSSSDDSSKKILAAIQALSGKDSTTPAAAPASSSGGGGGIGGDIGDIADVATAVLSWIICTELHRQGRMPTRWYIVGGRIFAGYNETAKQGYFLWAIPSVRHLRTTPNSLYSRMLCKIFLWRAENIANAAGVRGTRKLLRGALVTVCLWPVCYALGLLLAVLKLRVDYTQVYGDAK